MAEECESRNGGAEESESRWEKKSHCVKLDTAGTLEAFLLIVTVYSCEKRAKKLPCFNGPRAKGLGQGFVSNTFPCHSC